jgi:death-on-curing protein
VTRSEPEADPTTERTRTHYPDVHDTLAFYADMFGCTEQQARDQVRDLPGLESALARPRRYAEYEDADLSLQAAVLAHGIAERQAFLDGNKRTAHVAMRTFLAVNGFDVTADKREMAQWMLDLSSGLDVYELAERIRRYLRPLK